MLPPTENTELRKLININEDASEFYESAAELVESEELQKTFHNLENLHKSVLTNLQSYIRRNGGEVEASDGTLWGETNKMWGELMAYMSANVDKTLVNQLEEAEDRCLHTMEEVIKRDDVYEATKVFLQGEMASLQKSHDHMRLLKQAIAA